MELPLHIPEGIDPLTVMLSMPATAYQFLTTEMTNAQAEATMWQGLLAVEEAHSEDLQGAVTTLTTQNQTQGARIATLMARVQELEAQPVTSSRTITRQHLGRIIAFTIENGKTSPNLRQYATVKKAMDWGYKLGFEMFRIFLNPGEVREHVRPTEASLGNLITYAKSLGLRWMADTMDTIVKLLTKDADLKAHCDDLITLGCEGFYINDADAYPIEVLVNMVARLRKAAPDMPIFASLMASANLDVYRAIFDWLEIQTFGTPEELKAMLSAKDARGVKPVMCFDVRSRLSALDLATRAALVKKNPPEAFYYYADTAADYDAMPDEEDDVIKDLVTWLKAA